MFLFAVPGYNLRNTEFNAVLGLEQLGRLDIAATIRAENFKTWISNLDTNKFQTNYLEEGNSSFALPLILREKDKSKTKMGRPSKIELAFIDANDNDSD